MAATRQAKAVWHGDLAKGSGEVSAISSSKFSALPVSWAARTEARIRDIAGRIRQREFSPRPSYMACGLCAFRDICPHTARGPEAEER